jgi:DNA-directed RNA polymerase subunit beta
MTAVSFTSRKRIRKDFGRVAEIIPIPNLIEVQKRSYDQFLQINTQRDKREKSGLQEVFHSVFPIEDFGGRSTLEFVSYDFEQPKYDVEECQQRGITFGAGVRASLRLIVWDIDETTGARSIRDIKEQDVYMGDMPLMTGNGTFVINGTERVIVSQMHRSPGVFFDHDGGKSHSSGKFLFSSRIIPYRGSWLDFEFDAKDMLYVRIDRRRKLPVTSLLQCLDSTETEKVRAKATKEGRTLAPFEAQGMSREEMLTAFYGVITCQKNKKGWKTPFNQAALKGTKLVADLVDANSGLVVAEAGTKMTARVLKKLEQDGLTECLMAQEDLVGRYLAHDMVNEDTGEVLAEAGDEISTAILTQLLDSGLKAIAVLDIDHLNTSAHFRNTLVADKNINREEALVDVYRVMRPGEPPTLEAAEALFGSLFFDIERYDLSSVGRVKMNSRLNLDCPDTVRTLRKDDIVSIVRVLLELKDGKGDVDDIDHLGNRRIRSVGELMENQYRIGLLRMERAIKERMSAVDVDTVMPHDLINAKPVSAAVKEFFASSQLSQFMDQTNPLSEITHKRRLSALGPGGLSRDRAGFEVRDVHPTHYGRICPIETPEGPNIGLINSLATYARVNRYGFVEAPYRRVTNGKVTDEVLYMTAPEEEKHSILQANAAVAANGQIMDELVSVRKADDLLMVTPDQVDFIDVSPKQLVSVAASLIPFLENDDANRALMGSNMQRQAVPLLQSEAPLVGTGMEAAVARDSGAALTAKRNGVVDQVDARRIVVKVTEQEGENTGPGVDIYTMRKFQRSNQSTCINQRPLVQVGDVVETGDIIADGPATDLGELALGRNVLCAFMPWNGYNFEDSILISERIARDDVYTSIHIEEFEVMERDTKLGQEEITRDIPNVGEEALKNLDEAGIIYIGAEVKAGDVLVGKVTPKGESPMTPEEKLLRAIFGEKSADVRDTSLRVPPGVSGTVVEVRVFSRSGLDKDERALAIEQAEIQSLAKDRDAERSILERSYYARLEEKLLGQTVVKAPKGKPGQVVDAKFLEAMTHRQWDQVVVEDATMQDRIESNRQQFNESVKLVNARFEDKVEKLQRGDDLLPGVTKMVKVFLAVKRKLQPGDKMAGRHGNKGVVSRILPIEDMPHLEDGTAVDVVLNPLGVPSRMNVGQILETHLGWAAANLGKQIGQAYKDYADNGKKQSKPLFDKLGKVYGNKVVENIIKPMNDAQLCELVGNLKNGVPMATPVFDGAREEDINAMLTEAGLSTSGQVQLYDGRTGEPFDRQVTVGYIYILKLHHLVDDKIHARSTGPYSLVTQQPLGGKAQFGGQRFGEMEVWALQAYGAAYTLQEMLTVKSDDVSGRTKVYEAIVRGDDAFESGIPESFNVLMKEIRSLGLNIELVQRDDTDTPIGDAANDEDDRLLPAA